MLKSDLTPDGDGVEQVPRNVGLAVDEAVQQQPWQASVATNTIINPPSVHAVGTRAEGTGGLRHGGPCHHLSRVSM